MNYIPIQKLAAIAFFAYRICRGRAVSAVYSYDTSQYYNFSISSRGPVVGIFDYQRGNYLTGNKAGSGWSVFDYCDGQYLSFNPMSRGFSVFDYMSGSYIDVDLLPGQIQLFSYAESRYYVFGI